MKIARFIEELLFRPEAASILIFLLSLGALRILVLATY
jgi:hypothetical protein